MEGGMADPNWAIRGEYMESCNCDYLCPCVYTNPQGPVTYDNCYAVLVFRIDDGNFGPTRLDGCKFAFVLRSGKVMADGDWIFAVVVDETADPAQRDALAKLAGGEAGGTPGLIRTNLVSDFRGVEYQPLEFEMAGLTRRAAVPGVFAFEIEGVASRNRSGDFSSSTTPRIPPTGASRWHARKRCTCTALVSTSISPAAAITAISRRSRGVGEAGPARSQPGSRNL
jgi:hypothetical protein